MKRSVHNPAVSACQKECNQEKGTVKKCLNALRDERFYKYAYMIKLHVEW